MAPHTGPLQTSKTHPALYEETTAMNFIRIISLIITSMTDTFAAAKIISIPSLSEVDEHIILLGKIWHVLHN
jgi:hypothetical protein